MMVSRRIAIVEDEPLIAMDLALSLEAQGYETMVASSYKDAVRQIEEACSSGRPPSAAIIDVELGRGGDGIAAATSIRKVCGPGLVVIYSTGYTSGSVKARAGLTAPTAIFCKPYNPVALLACLHAALECSR